MIGRALRAAISAAQVLECVGLTDRGMVRRGDGVRGARVEELLERAGAPCVFDVEQARVVEAGEGLPAVVSEHDSGGVRVERAGGGERIEPIEVEVDEVATGEDDPAAGAVGECGAQAAERALVGEDVGDGGEAEVGVLIGLARDGEDWVSAMVERFGLMEDERGTHEGSARFV